MAQAWWQQSTPDQPDQNQWWNQDNFFGNIATDDQQPKSNDGFFGSLTHAVGNVVNAGEKAVEGAGSFFGGIVKGVASDAVNTVKTAKNVGEAVYHDVTDPGKIKANTEAYQQATHDYQSGKITLDQLNDKFKEFQANSQKISAGINNEGILKDKQTAGQQAASAGSTFLNLATLGIGGGVKALAQGGAKEIAETAANSGVKAAAKKTGQVLLTNGASDAKNAILKEALDEGGSTAAKAAAAHVAENSGSNALLGAGYGAIDTAQNPNATPGEAVHNALIGGITGGALGAGDSLLNRDVRGGLREVPGAIRDAKGNLIKPVYAHQDDLGAVSNDYHASQTNPEEQQQTQLAQEVAAHYNSPKDYLQSTTKQAYNYDKTQSGGDLNRISNPTGPDEMTRTSSHTPFYRDYFAATGKAPTKAAYQAQIEDALTNGTDGGGLIHPQESEVYSLLKDREGSTRALTDDPSAAFETARQQHLDALNSDSSISEKPLSEIQSTTSRPNGDIQKQIEDAHNSGDNAKVTDLITQLPAEDQASMRSALGIPEPTTDTNLPNQRGLLKTMQNDKTATPEFKQALGEVDPQTYETRHLQPLIDEAKQTVETDPEAATSHILSTKGLSDKDMLTGAQLTAKLSKEGKISQAVDIATHMDEDAREHGRSISALQTIGNLTPEGVLRFAAKKVRKASEKISAGRGFEKGETGAKKLAKGIQQQIEESPKLTKDDVTQAVRDTAQSKLKVPTGGKPGEGQLDIEGNPVTTATNEVTTGEKLAKKIENAVTPQVKKKADTLVNEIYKKVKQEQLAQKPVTKNSAIDVMREVFSRNKEAQEAFPEAQRILLEHSKNNPVIRDQLQKFFDSELGHPVASSTLDNAVKEQLTKNETKIADVIHKSWTGQKQSVEDVASALVKEGFDEDSAKAISKEVTDRLNAQVATSKQKVLERMAKEAPKRLRQQYVDKIAKLSNLGALDKSDYLELARNRLKLPHLTEDVASDISTLAQKMQDTPEGAERDAVAREIYKRIDDSIPKTKAQIAAEIVSAPKAIMASYDLSGTLRQGGVLGSRFRTEAKDAFKKQIDYFKSEDAFHKGMSAIKQDPLHEMALRANIALTGTEGAEEAFVSQLPEKIPILGKGVQASDRAYTGALTELRFNSFKHIMNDLTSGGIDISSLSDEQLKSIGKFINTASGRGYGEAGGLFEKMTPALNRTLFSPRLWKSRLDMLNPLYYHKLDPIARKYALQSAGSFAAIAGTVLGLASLAGAQVETDPRSSDFLKAKVGNTRYDILGGFQQNLVFAWRELSGQKKSSTSGDITDLTSGKFGGANRLSILSDLVANKENPAISTASDLLKGTDDAGNKVNPYTELSKLFIPLNAQDTYAAAKDTNPLEAIFNSTIPGTLGVGVNTYQDTPSASDPYGTFHSALNGK